MFGFYFPEPRAEVYCFKENFNISKLVYMYCFLLFFSLRNETKPSLDDFDCLVEHFFISNVS